MNILIFNWRDIKHSWAGGGEIYIFEQAKRWVKMGHNVTLFCGEDIADNLPEQEIINGIHVYRRGTRYSVYVWAIWYYLTVFNNKFDILIDVVNGIPFFSPLFSRLPKLSFVYHIHGDQFFYEIPFPFNYIGYAIEKYLFPLIYRGVPMIAISKTTKFQLIKYGFNKRNIHIVYCGNNLPISGRGSKGKKSVHPTILYLGRIKKYKRVDLLVKIFPQIVEVVPKTRLIIAGWGTEASSITELVMKSPLRRKIYLMGPVTNDEKRRLLSKSWLFVNPSIGEGWSIAVIEANLYETPAAAFNVPGLSESIQNKITGVLAKDERELIDCIRTILMNKSYCAKLGTHARLRAEQFSWDKTARRSIQVIKQVITN